MSIKSIHKWGLGIGDWGLGIRDCPIPNPQSPIPYCLVKTNLTNLIFTI